MGLNTYQVNRMLRSMFVEKPFPFSPHRGESFVLLLLCVVAAGRSDAEAEKSLSRLYVLSKEAIYRNEDLSVKTFTIIHLQIMFAYLLKDPSEP